MMCLQKMNIHVKTFAVVPVQHFSCSSWDKIPLLINFRSNQRSGDISPLPPPLSPRWSYPGRGQTTFKKIIEKLKWKRPHWSRTLVNWATFRPLAYLARWKLRETLVNLISKFLQEWLISQSRALATPKVLSRHKKPGC